MEEDAIKWTARKHGLTGIDAAGNEVTVSEDDDFTFDVVPADYFDVLAGGFSSSNSPLTCFEGVGVDSCHGCIREINMQWHLRLALLVPVAVSSAPLTHVLPCLKILTFC